MIFCLSMRAVTSLTEKQVDRHSDSRNHRSALVFVFCGYSFFCYGEIKATRFFASVTTHYL